MVPLVNPDDTLVVAGFRKDRPARSCPCHPQWLWSTGSVSNRTWRPP